jgi:hypothetical protein
MTGLAMEHLEADYLVIGSGACSMAFVDTMLEETDASFVIVDRHHMPGGHWNDAYPFVRLHQPSAFYGVASTELGAMRIDESGSNKGLYELASGAEVSAYFDRVMRERFLPSGRVRYFPMCDCTGDSRFRSLVGAAEYAVNVRRKTVDGTFFKTSVPSTHQRAFEVEAGVECVAPNELPARAAGYRRFTVLGGGKTGMDAAVWLLEAGADPDAITWVCPRDSWLINRYTTQPGNAFFERSAGGFAAQLEAMQAATSIDDIFDRLEAAGVMLRIDPRVRPTMFHYATISPGEIEELRRIRNVVRNGRVVRVGAEELIMANGESVADDPETLYVDCTASAVPFVGTRTGPVFSGDRITIQAVRAPLVATSAALIAFVEANYDDEELKNQLCTPIGLADTPTEWLLSFLGNLTNQDRWSREPEIRRWMDACRLNPARPMPGDRGAPEPAQSLIAERISRSIRPAIANIRKLLAESLPERPDSRPSPGAA